MHPRWRWSLLSLAAIATGMATFLAPEDKPLKVAASSQRAPEVTPAVLRQPAPAVDRVVDLPFREPIGRQRGDMFATRSWTPKPAAVAQKPEPPKPPPNPYRFAGTTQLDGARKVFLLQGDRIFEAKEGETLEQGFRVQSVTADAVTLVYVPLEVPVTMALAFQDAPPPAPAAAGATAQPANASEGLVPGQPTR